MQEKQLYFIALIPDQNLSDRVKLLKEEMKKNFNAKHALKSPAHITLQMPFKKESDFEPEIIATLNEFASKQNHFIVKLSGFDHFNQRAIYLKVLNHTSINMLHTSLLKTLKNKLHLDTKDLSHNILPHMTIATRDLDSTHFSLTWNTFKERSFETQFSARSIFLLKHNGKFWDIYREFLFAK